MRQFVEVTGTRPGARVLDLACGAGRHLERLAGEGFRAIGMDLSPHLLAEAADRPGLRGRLVQGDMRALPFRDGAFDALVSFFTSFGYFATREEDARVVREMRRVLEPGADFMLDYLNAPWVRDNLVPRSDGERSGRRVRETRWLEGDTVMKRIEIFDTGDGRAGESAEDGREPEVFFERVRLYEPDGLERLLGGHGLAAHRRLGGYHGEPFDRSSPRLVLVGRAS